MKTIPAQTETLIYLQQDGDLCLHQKDIIDSDHDAIIVISKNNIKDFLQFVQEVLDEKE